MASNKAYLDFVLKQLSELDEIAYRAMMGEYILYYRGKIVGGIYDNRLLVKPVQSAVSLMKSPTHELPYEGAKEMLLVDQVDSKEFLTKLLIFLRQRKRNKPNLIQKDHEYFGLYLCVLPCHTNNLLS